MNINSTGPLYATTGVAMPTSDVGTVAGYLNEQLDLKPDNYEVQINWGDSGEWSPDGNASGDSQVVDTGSTQFLTLVGSHTYAQPGQYPVHFIVTGPDGTTADMFSSWVIVSNPPAPAPTPTPEQPPPTTVVETPPPIPSPEPTPPIVAETPSPPITLSSYTQVTYIKGGVKAEVHREPATYASAAYGDTHSVKDAKPEQAHKAGPAKAGKTLKTGVAKTGTAKPGKTLKPGVAKTAASPKAAALKATAAKDDAYSTETPAWQTWTDEWNAPKTGGLTFITDALHAAGFYQPLTIHLIMVKGENHPRIDGSQGPPWANGIEGTALSSAQRSQIKTIVESALLPPWPTGSLLPSVKRIAIINVNDEEGPPPTEKPHKVHYDHFLRP
jgi:hypothetical protein